MLRRFEMWCRRVLKPYPRLWALAKALRELARPVLNKTGVTPHRANAKPHWDKMVDAVETGEHKGWLDWEFIETEYIRPQVSGDRSVYYLHHFFDTHIKKLPVARALSLGCGGGNLERALIQMNTARAIDAFDASPESIRLAKELAEGAGMAGRICYEVQDINQLELQAGSYDFVIAKMSLHHFENLEHVYEQVGRALKPGGLFMFNEFIGPSRYQWTDLQLELMNKLIEVLPEENRAKMPLLEIERPTIEEMIAVDPTESVRSAEILPVLKNYFEIAEYKPYGGTLLHIFLTHAMPTFDLEDESQRALLRTVFLYERTLVQNGVLPSDFAYVVGRPRKQSRGGTGDQ